MGKRRYEALIYFCVILSFPIHGIAGTISGMVTEESTGTPISGMDMNLYDSDWNYIPIDATTDNGTYTFFNVPAGQYFVKANPGYPYHFLAEYWDNARSRADALILSLSDDQNLQNVDFALSPGWYIGGKVLDSAGISLPSIDINVYDTQWNRLDVDAETDEFGRYYIGGLPEGEYYVMANPIYPQPYIDQYFDHSNGPNNASLVTLANQEDLIGISFDLEAGSYILGRVRDADTGIPIPRISLKAYNRDHDKMRIEARSQSDGDYILGAYRPGDYFVRADPEYPDGYMDQFYAHAYTWDDAQLISVTLEKPTTGIHFNLPPGSYIRGTIFSEYGNLLPDIKVTFFDSSWNAYDLTTTRSDDSGQYLSGALRAGAYYVKAVPVFPQPYIDEYYDDALEKEDADPVEVVLRQETTGIDFTLRQGGYLAGTVRSAVSGEPLPDIDLDVYNGLWEWVDYSDHTNSSGEFLIGALPFREYYLRCDPTSDQGYMPQFFDHVFWSIEATLIPLTPVENISGLDFDLAPGGKISGRITRQDQDIPISGIPVEVYSLNLQKLPLHPVTSQADGEYTASGIPGGSYYVKAAPEPDMGYDAEYYSESMTIDGAIPVTVTIENTTGHIDFTLRSNISPTPTPPIPLGVEIEMPRDYYRHGDLFYTDVRVANPGPPLGELPLFVVLDVFGQLFFWPSWRVYNPPEQTNIDYRLVDIISGVQIVPVLPAFRWPDVQGSASDITFYAALTNPEMTALIGEADFITFGYGH